MKDSKLVRRAYSNPHLSCIKYSQTLEVLCKMHNGKCGNRTTNKDNHSHSYLSSSMSIELSSLENCVQINANHNVLEKEQENAIIRVIAYEQQWMSYYTKKAKIRQFNLGTLYLEKISFRHKARN